MGLERMKIGIIGYGVVGKAVALTLSKAYDLVRYDKYAKLDLFKDLKDCKIIFVTVPTPFDCETNCVDESAILESLDKLQKINYNSIVIIKSTLPPGYSDRYAEEYDFTMVFNPEFLRESTTPNEDFANQETVVIGTENATVFSSVKEMYQKALQPSAKYYHTSLAEAEMIKCAQNTMLASRVALANMIYDACEQNEINYNKVRELAFDKFKILGPHMVQVPGPDGRRGFGGKCLPKDIRAFSTVQDSDLLNNIIKYNDSLRNDLGNYLENFKKH